MFKKNWCLWLYRYLYKEVFIKDYKILFIKIFIIGLVETYFYITMIQVIEILNFWYNIIVLALIISHMLYLINLIFILLKFFIYVIYKSDEHSISYIFNNYYINNKVYYTQLYWKKTLNQLYILQKCTCFCFMGFDFYQFIVTLS